ncbi:MAG: hypothetical protein PQJ60_13265, partial [Spirochaetales bacterium]|nr:hypothetical protein [Spirochaetales bacterium]
MKKSVVTLYSILVILALIVLCGWLGYNYYTGTAEKQSEFTDALPSLNKQVADLLDETKDPGSDQFKSSMEDFLTTRPEIKGLLIYSGNDKLYYTRLESKNSRLMENLKKNESFLLEKINNDSYRAPFGMKQESTALTSVENTPLSITYLHETFSPVRIYQMLLNALYVISGLFLLTLIFMLALSTQEKKKGVEKNDDFFEPPAPDPSQVSEGTAPPPPGEIDLSDFDTDDALLSEESQTADMDLDSLDFDLGDSSESDLDDFDFYLPDEADGAEPDLGPLDFDLPEPAEE